VRIVTATTLAAVTTTVSYSDVAPIRPLSELLAVLLVIVSVGVLALAVYRILVMLLAG